MLREWTPFPKESSRPCHTLDRYEKVALFYMFLLAWEDIQQSKKAVEINNNEYWGPGVKQ